MDTKYKVIICVVALAGSFAFGRYSAPEKIKIQTQTVEVEKKTDTTDKTLDINKHKETITKEVVNKDGSKEITTTTVEDTGAKKNTVQNETVQDSKTTTEKKEIIKSSGVLNISALVGAGVSFSGGISLTPPIYGVSINRSLLGPVTVGLWGLSNATGGLSVGLNF